MPIWSGGRRRRSWPTASSSAAASARTIFGVEANQFQELLGAEFAAELARQKLIGIVPWAIENRVNKQTRIRRLGPYLSNRRIKFKSGSPGTRLLVEQLQQFPLGDHDDGPDALEMAIRLAAEWFDRRGRGDGLGDGCRSACSAGIAHAEARRRERRKVKKRKTIGDTIWPTFHRQITATARR